MPKKITENVYLVNGPVTTNPRDCDFFVVLGEKPVLIDCGSGEGHEKNMESLGELGVDAADVDCVILTHCHYDHAAGIGPLREDNPSIRLAVHEADAGPLEEPDHEATCADWMFDAGPAPQKTDIQFAGDTLLELGGRTFEIIHTPGHSPGSCCIRLDIDGKTLLFTGDCFVPSCGRVRGDLDDWRESLEKLAETDFDAVLPGHPLQWAFNPFYTAMMQPVSKELGRLAYRFFMENFTGPIWRAGTLHYENVIPVMTRLSDFVFGRLAR